ncbi:MAG: hypothetical protein BGO01_17565 [Armatimonadetes bacterium 55-13]|nr:FAD-dependent oxidoreductase [Armatimonadota bacterium]OJU63952.1 MAG: hypothetical protein BGO01_17565 [Armatimonadetes bacterium 55-13]
MVKPVVVVGAGLAGLACARKLYESGVPVIVVDADDRPGGRLKTDKVEGFQLDRGFQVFFTAYPHAKRQLDLESLNLKSFKNGAQVYFDGSLHKLELQTFKELLLSKFELLRDKTIPLADKKKLAKLCNGIGSMSPREISRLEPMTTLEYLEDFGFSDEAIDRFFRPFLGGIFLDRDLKVDSRQFAFVWSMLQQGQTVVPNAGIEAIATQISADIPRYLFRFGNKVSEIIRDDSGHPCGVRFDTSEEIAASAVVLATEAPEAARLSGHATVEGAKSSTCLYFETGSPCVDGAYLVLNGTGQGIVNHVAPISNAAPSYAPAGKYLASVTILGNPAESDQNLAEIAKAELTNWFPDKGANMWRFIRGYRVPYAQMAQPVGFMEKAPGNAVGTPGLYQAGEFTENSSIDGAIRSGVECAALLLSEREATEAA